MLLEAFLTCFPRNHRNGPGDVHVPCPAHDDSPNDPSKWSLHITATDDRLLLHCFAGCAPEEILRALNLKPSDLFFDNNGHGHVPGPALAPAGWTQVIAPKPEPGSAQVTPEPVPTLETFAALKQIPKAMLEAEGWLDTRKGIAIPYRQRDGSVWRVRGRTSLRPGAGFLWDGHKDRPLIPYGRHRLDDAIDKGELFLVEGESDTVTAWLHGLPCLGLPGNLAAKALAAEDLAGIDVLWIVVEPGQSGEGFVKSIRARLQDLAWHGTAKLVRLSVKDLSDLHVLHADNPEAFLKAVRAAQAEAVDLPQVVITASDDAVRAPVPLATLLHEIWDEIESGRKPIVVPTPFPVLNDSLDGGWALTELVYIAASTSAGKSALALQSAITAARAGHGVLIISREMSNKLLARRIVSQEARVRGRSLRRNTLDAEEKRLVKVTLPSLEALPITLTNTAKSIDDIEREVARFSGAAPLRLLIVDYVQLVGAAKGIKERRLQVENISERLRNLAVEYNIAVIAISSLNRTGLSESGRPTLASLRESSELEFDGDVILLLHREFGKRETECAIAKNRNGEQGVVLHFIFEWEYTSFQEG